MKKLLWTLPIAAIFLAGCGSAPSASTNQPPGNNQSIQNTSPSSTSDQKLSDQSYFSSAHLISSDTLDTGAKMALTGFQLSKKTLLDGSTQIDLKALEPQYHDQSYNLKSGQQLYFIDKFPADDQGGTEAQVGDDTAVIVDANGMIIQGPSGF
jgi:hypothetical protein